MRFFTADWWLDGQEEGRPLEVERLPFDLYEKHINSIRDRLSPPLLRIATEWFLHDGILRRLTLTPATATMRMSFGIDDEGDAAIAHLDYGRVEALECQGPSDQRLRTAAVAATLKYWEVDVCPGGSSTNCCSIPEWKWRFVSATST